jgi:septum formation protein
MPEPGPLILASASPRRRELLAERGYHFTVVTMPVTETLPPHLTVREAVLLNARSKGAPVAALHPGACIVAADTLVSLEGRALGKPANLREARSMLKMLSGRTHQVFSGVWIEQRNTSSIAAFTEVSHVHFRPISPREIATYTEQVHVLDKAGAYAAQQDPIGLIQSIEGSRTNVIGLPMERLEPMLAQRGYCP